MSPLSANFENVPVALVVLPLEVVVRAVDKGQLGAAVLLGLTGGVFPAVPEAVEVAVGAPAAAVLDHGAADAVAGREGGLGLLPRTEMESNCSGLVKKVWEGPCKEIIKSFKNDPSLI